MAVLPASWGLKEQPRADGKLDLVGKDVAGNDYVARTTDCAGVTERDLELLAVGNRETSTAKQLVEYYQGQKDNLNKRIADESLDGYMEGAERVTHAGLHLFSISFSHIAQEKWDAIWRD